MPLNAATFKGVNMKEENKIGVLELNETSRTYLFPNGNEIIIDNAVECRINKINTHNIVTKQGEIYIVPYRWLAMKYIPAKEASKDIK